MSDIESLQDQRLKVKAMIERHKLVENLVHRQGMPRHDIVESMVQQNNFSELRRFLEKLDFEAIANILESFTCYLVTCK
jgi:hypothetical protein